LYTQCPQCGSVFRVTAATLRIAGGLVRCGVCNHGFDALAALTDDETAPPSGALTEDEQSTAPAPDDTITVEELGAGEVIELGAANDDLLADEVPGSAADDAPPAAEDEPGVIDVIDSSVAGVETITLSSDDEAAAETPPEAPAVVSFDAPDSDAAVEPGKPACEESAAEETAPAADVVTTIAPAADAQPAEVQGDLSQMQEARDSGAAEPHPEALEFTGSEEDLARVFVAAREPPLPARSWVPPAATAADLASRPDAAGDVSRLVAAVEALESAEEQDLTGTPAPDFTDAITGVRPDAEQPQEMEAAAVPAAAELPGPETGTGRYSDLDATDEYPILVLDETDAPDAETARRFALEPAEAETAAEPAPETAAAADTAPPEADAGNVMPAILIPEGLRRTMQTRGSPEADEFATPAFALDTPGWWERSRVWVAVSMLAVLALFVQAVHYNRETLARHPVAGPWLLGTYDLLDLEAPVPSDLAAIELRQWGASSDPRRPGRLRLRASLLNRASFAQPYPVLRVTLHDRFGNAVGSRDIGARDYLPGAAPDHRLLPAGQRIDAEIGLVDPGNDAVGYEIDLCREDRDGVRCRGAAAPAQ
jgi:predicted Zn finger-like uncharacterized protein